MTENAVILIDEGYLSKIKKHFGNGNYIKGKVNHLATNLCKDLNLWCEEIYYYTCPPYQSPTPTADESERKKNYDIYVRKLNSQMPRTYVREGRLQKDNLGKFHQKGVDTHITMDLMKIAQSRETRNIILLACDTDFVPILNEIRKMYRVKIILAYFFDGKRNSTFSMSNHILTACDDKILIRKDHFNLPSEK